MYDKDGNMVGEKQFVGESTSNFITVTIFNVSEASTYYIGSPEDGKVGVFHLAVMYNGIDEDKTATEVAAVPATCETAGKPKYYISNFGRYFESDGETIINTPTKLVIDALNHDYQLVDGTLVAPGLDDTGSATVKCSYDETHTQTVTIPNLNSSVYGEPEEVEGNMLKYTYVDEDTNATITFTVQKITTYTVTFVNSNLKPAKVEPGDTVSEPEEADLTDENATFVGWYSDSELTDPFDFENTQINADTNIYAKWTGKFVEGELTKVELTNLTSAKMKASTGVVTFVDSGSKSSDQGSTTLPYQDDATKSITSSALKTGGKSSSTLNIKLDLPQTCTVSVVMRSGSGGKERSAFISKSITNTLDTSIAYATNSDTSKVAAFSVELSKGVYYLNFTDNINIFEIKVNGGSQTTTDYDGITGEATKTSYTADEAKAGIDLSGLTLTTNDGTVALNATNASGLYVAITQDGEDASAAFKAGTAGTYKVTVGKYNMAVTYEVTVA